jgi:hypothetical protein
MAGAGGLDVGLVGRRVRGYFAPVNRAAGAPVIFDAAVLGRFAVGAAPAPWVDLGWCSGFKRISGTKVAEVLAGAPATVAGQVRTQVGAEIGFEFETWGRLQMALAAGSQSMNLLKVAAGAAANASGGVAETAIPLEAGSTASSLVVGVTAAAGFSVGDLVAVDVDYVGQVGFVGTGVSGAYVKSSAAVGGDINYVRRVTLNVGRVATVSGGALGLELALPAGIPAAGMQVSPMVGFCDREGGSFFAEWSAVFVMDGEQGDRVIFHYPRLQAMQGALELGTALGAGMDAGLERVRLVGAYRALPVVDGNDGESCVSFRSYFPAAR